MICDLHSGPLDAQRWGAKAANLSRLATAGILVPPGLCLWPRVVSTEARDRAIGAWLTESRAESVIVRSSSANEDGPRTAGAGRSLSLPAVAPDPRAVTDAIDVILATPEGTDSVLRSVIVQHEVLPALSGVAFARRTGELIIEADAERFAVTSGSTVGSHARVDRNGTSVVEPGWLANAVMRGLSATAASCISLLDDDLDIEWGYLAGGIFVFQARPITKAVDG